MTLRKAIWFIAAAETLFWAGLYYVFAALIVRWEAEFGWSKAELTAGITISIVSAALISPFAGRLIDRGYGPKLLVGGGVIGALALIGVAFVESLPQFYGLWALIGASTGCCLYDPCFSFMVKVRGLEAKRAITIVTLLAGLAGTIAFPLCHMLSDAFGWRSAIFVFAGLIILFGVPLMWKGTTYLSDNALEEEAELTEDTPQEGRFNFLFGAKFWLLSIGFTLLYMNHVAILNHLLLLLKEWEFDPELAVMAATFIGPMQLLGRMSMMVLERVASNTVVTITCFVFVILGNVALMTSFSAPTMLALFIILQGSGIGVLSIMKPMVTRDILGGENFGLKNGAFSVPYQVGSAFSGLIGSLIWAMGDYNLMLKVMIFWPAIGLVMFILAHLLARKSPL
ncbi:MAG: MFS transporter [Sneathiellales bacterium]|nr:MFS transporter [Sneathiellales bacterium]